jgi:hypothetical protein
MCRACETELTLKRVDANLLTQLEGFFDFLLFNTLDTQTGKAARHGITVQFDGADPFAATLFANQVVGMGFVGGFRRNQ